jgi:hypothetical protein
MASKKDEAPLTEDDYESEEELSKDEERKRNKKMLREIAARRGLPATLSLRDLEQRADDLVAAEKAENEEKSQRLLGLIVDGGEAYSPPRIGGQAGQETPTKEEELNLIEFEEDVRDKDGNYISAIARSVQFLGGITVTTVDGGSVAEKAGIKSGMRIASMTLVADTGEESEATKLATSIKKWHNKQTFGHEPVRGLGGVRDYYNPDEEWAYDIAGIPFHDEEGKVRNISAYVNRPVVKILMTFQNPSSGGAPAANAEPVALSVDRNQSSSWYKTFAKWRENVYNQKLDGEGKPKKATAAYHDALDTQVRLKGGYDSYLVGEYVQKVPGMPGHVLTEEAMEQVMQNITDDTFSEFARGFKAFDAEKDCTGKEATAKYNSWKDRIGAGAEYTSMKQWCNEKKTDQIRFKVLNHAANVVTGSLDEKQFVMIVLAERTSRDMLRARMHGAKRQRSPQAAAAAPKSGGAAAPKPQPTAKRRIAPTFLTVAPKSGGAAAPKPKPKPRNPFNLDEVATSPRVIKYEMRTSKVASNRDVDFVEYEGTVRIRSLNKEKAALAGLSPGMEVTEFYTVGYDERPGPTYKMGPYFYRALKDAVGNAVEFDHVVITVLTRSTISSRVLERQITEPTAAQAAPGTADDPIVIDSPERARDPNYAAFVDMC